MMYCYRLIPFFFSPLMLLGCGSDDVGSPDPPSTIEQCHPFAGASQEPAQSQRSTSPPTEAVAWTPMTLPPYEGPLAANTELEGADLIGPATQQPEDVLFDELGRLYTGTKDGTIWRASNPSGEAQFEPLGQVNAGALGLAFDPCGNIVVASPNRGLVALSPSGEVATLADRVDGTLIEFADELAVAADGTVYFSDASTKYTGGWPYDFLEGNPYGRLLAYEPESGEVRVVLDDLYFANGVLVAADESYVLVAESFRYRVQRHWLAGPNVGTTEVFAENLSVIPDNLTADSDGNIWIPGRARSAALDELVASLETRESLLELSYEELVNFGGGAEPPYALVVVIGPDGQPIHSLHGPSGALSSVSAAVPHEGFVYFGQLGSDNIARIPLPATLPAQ